MARPAAPRTKGLLHRVCSLTRDRPAAGKLLCMAALRLQVLQSEHPIRRICTLQVPTDLVHRCGPLRHRLRHSRARNLRRPVSSQPLLSARASRAPAVGSRCARRVALAACQCVLCIIGFPWCHFLCLGLLECHGGESRRSHDKMRIFWQIYHTRKLFFRGREGVRE